MKLSTFDSVDVKKNAYNYSQCYEFEDLLQRLEAASEKNRCFFRGLSNGSYKIYSSMQREWITRELNYSYRTFQNLNQSFLDYVKGSYAPLLNKYCKVDTDISIFSVLQHYGAPTPFIDWTSDFKVALYFASLGNDFCTGLETESFVSIYWLEVGEGAKTPNNDLTSFAEMLGAHKDNMKSVVQEHESVLGSDYKEATRYSVWRNVPLWMEESDDECMKISNSRSSLQRGAFVYYPQADKSLDELFNGDTVEHFLSSDGNSRSGLFLPKIHCIDVHKSLLPKIRKYLRERNYSKTYLGLDDNDWGKDSFFSFLARQKRIPMFYKLSKNAFVRKIGKFGYIFNQLTKHDRTYDGSGDVLLKQLTRMPQEFEIMVQNLVRFFEIDDAESINEISTDFKDFLDSLVADRYVVVAETFEECKDKDYEFSFSENPKTAFNYNALQNPDDLKKNDTSEFLLQEYLKEPRVHGAQIEVTNRCNERCIHCYIPHELKNDLLPYDVIANVLEQLHEMGTLTLTLSGGEFFCHPDAAKILRKARELDFTISVLSNITLLTPQMIDVLKEVNLSMLQTSLYSVVDEEHDHITQLKGSCQKTKASIDALIAAGIPVQINCPVMKSNYHSYKDVLKYAYERNIKAQTDFIMMARFDFTTDNLAERLDMKETESLLLDTIQFDKDYLNLVEEVPQNQMSREEWAKQPMCGVARDNLCIAANGVVYPCSGWQGMACGNVREQPIKDIWEKSPQLNELRKITKGSIPGCYDCEDKEFCAACLVRNFNENHGDYLKVADHFCKAAALNKKLVMEHLKNK